MATINYPSLEILLKAHGMYTETRENRLFVLEQFTINDAPGFNWLDCTEWTKKEAFQWLGY